MSDEPPRFGPTAPRRSFLRAAISGAAALGACSGGLRGGAAHPRSERAVEVGPGEDLMQEHGVVERLLLVYDTSAGRLLRGDGFDPLVVAEAASVVHDFVEGYHERLEEEFLFPRMTEAGVEVELVRTLKAQHDRGREITEAISTLARTQGDRQAYGPLIPLVAAFGTMYRAHAAREDTVLFPAFRRLVGADTYHELGERFEEREHARLGENGFEEVVSTVARLERALGIHELDWYTPPSPSELARAVAPTASP